MNAREFVLAFKDQFKTIPYEHQLVGAEKFLLHPAFGNLDEMGAGKTKQVVDGACLLYKSGTINVVLALTPASIRRNWLNKLCGEISKHCWLPHVAYEFHQKGLRLFYETSREKPRLVWIVTNYEFIQREEHRRNLIKIIKDKKTWLIADESSFISSYRAGRTKAAMEIREYCPRASLLNGTPVGNSVETLFSQMNFLDKRILGIKYITHFRRRYCVLQDVYKKDEKGIPRVALIPGTNNKLQKVVGVQNGEELQRKIAPFVIRRLKADCMDLPDIVDVAVPVKLTPKTWELYKRMRDEAIVMLENDKVSMAPYTITKIMRMAQICSGLLGGVEDELGGEKTVEVISSEKRDYALEFLKDRLQIDPNFRLIIWTRFRKEQELLNEAIKQSTLKTTIHRIYGQQPADEREAATVEMKIGSGPVTLLGQPQAGGLGLDFTTAHNSMYISQSYDLIVRLQSRDRTHRHGQKFKVTNYDLVAEGPRGEPTIDWSVVEALQRKENIATWTASAWREKLIA